MKKLMKLFGISCLMICLGALSLSAQSKEEKKKEKEKEVRELVESGNYKINVSMALPRRGRSIHLTSSYSLEVRNDSVISTLPFYGRAYSIPYGGGNGLSFKAPISEYKVDYNQKKGRSRINIVTRNSEDTFKYTIDIYSNGNSNIDVNMQNRESMSYTGEIELLPL